MNIAIRFFFQCKVLSIHSNGNEGVCASTLTCVIYCSKVLTANSNDVELFFAALAVETFEQHLS